MSSCFGRRRARQSDVTEPLLPRYEDDTDLQRRVHQKLHTYQMLRALSEGYMPSTEQLVANLRSLLASDILNPTGSDLSFAGRQLARDCKLWVKALVELLLEKNNEDQLQNALWHISLARASLDISDIGDRAANVKGQADIQAGRDLVEDDDIQGLN